MRVIPTASHTIVLALDESVCSVSRSYTLQYGGQKEVVHLHFQEGPRGLPEAVSGISEEDLLTIVQDRLESCQAGALLCCKENYEVLMHIKRARDALNRRTARRVEQGTEAHLELAPPPTVPKAQFPNMPAPLPVGAIPKVMPAPCPPQAPAAEPPDEPDAWGGLK